jgi:Domain of unknown function (DUF4404)
MAEGTLFNERWPSARGLIISEAIHQPVLRRVLAEYNDTMNQETLQKALKALHQALSDAPALDERSRELLRQIIRDAEGYEPTATALPRTMRRHRLEEIAVEFEVDYPALATGLRQLVDLLAKAGL